MSPRDLLWQLWAPEAGAWSAWVKPVLFSHMSPWLLPGGDAVPAGLQAPAAHADTAYVLDLPGPAAILAWGARFGPQGIRPVPLYNAVPGPSGFLLPPSDPHDEPIIVADPPAAGPSHPIALVNVTPIKEALQAWSPFLEALRLPPDSPPAFLLDADRGTGEGPLLPGRFDNRSVSFATDFPSATRLLSRGITQAVLVQTVGQGSQPRADLAHTLRRWQEGGIRLFLDVAQDGTPPRPLDVTVPGAFRLAWQRFMALLGLRRNVLGGFGGEIPVPSRGGGGG